jgi:hypothetical protein
MIKYHIHRRSYKKCIIDILLNELKKKKKTKKATCNGTIQIAIFLNFLPTSFFLLLSLPKKNSHFFFFIVSLIYFSCFQNFLILFIFHISFFPKFSLIISLSTSLFSQKLKNKIFKKNTIIIKNKINKI